MQQIVLDFDGPLFDARKAAHVALEKTIQYFESRFARPPLTFATLPLFSPKILIPMFYNDLEKCDREEVRRVYETNLYQAERNLGIHSHIHDALQALKSLGCTLAVFSSRTEDDLRSLMGDFGLLKYFSSLGASPTFRKPSGDFLCQIANQSQTEANKILFIGDSDLDYLAAKEAGVTYYHAGWTGEPVSLTSKKDSAVLDSLADLVSIVDASSHMADATEAGGWIEAVENRHFAFYGGAGISILSGVGGWEEHYRPVLSRLSAGYLEHGMELPEALQLLAANPLRAKKVFDAFSDSFVLREASPNSFHFAMLRSGAEHVWTSNYDTLLERADTHGHFGRRTVRCDSDLLDSFRAPNIIVKMNGDFGSAHFRDDLDWGLVFLQGQFDRGEKERPEIWRLFEEDYRQRSIIFVGVSFRDPILRRILAVARQRITSTRYNHYLVVKREVDPIARIKQAMFADSLRRSCIVTLFKDSYADILDFVQQVALTAYRPIVGFSGNVGRLANDVTEEQFKNTVPQGMTMAAAEIARVCRILGTQLARKKYRVTSGCSLFVGIPPVEAAFAVNPALGRFYLRQQGGSRYRGSAPAIVVKGADYASMRSRFIPELSALIAVGGRPDRAQPSGTIEEVDMALDRGIPVILLKCVGGDIEEHYDRLRVRMFTVYKDERLRKLVQDVNDEAAQVPTTGLYDFARDQLPELLEKVLSNVMGATSAEQRPDEARAW